MLGLLARKGANLNVGTDTGATLAHIAARDGDSDCLKVLCERGADVDAVNQLGNTPIMFAAMAGDVDVSFVGTLESIFRCTRCISAKSMCAVYVPATRRWAYLPACPPAEE